MLLFFDIDGTLFSNRTHTIPDSAIRAISQARKNGHLAFINTGRTKAGMQKILWDLPFDGYLLGCGSRIIYHGDTLLASSFPMETGRKIISLMDDFGIDAFLEGSEDDYVKREPYHLPIMNKVTRGFMKMGLCLSAFIEDGNFLYDKFVVMSDDEEKAAGFFKSVEPWVDVIDRGLNTGINAYECVQKGYSKASAMRFISGHLGIPLSESLAFGDSSNDLTMLCAAGSGVAMGEHSPVIESCCSFITETVENDGIAAALEHFGLI